MKKMDAFEKELTNCERRLRSFAMRLYRNPTAADDAVQDTLCRALANRSKFESGSDMMAWLGAIMFNAMCAYRRRNDTKRTVYPGALDYADHVAAPDDPHRTLEVKQALELVETLPTKYRNAVLAASLELTGEDMVAEFGCTLIAARKRLHLGRKLMNELTGAVA